MKSMRQLINLMEGVVAVPGVGNVNEEYDRVGFIKQAIGDIHPEAMSDDALKIRVGHETGYGRDPNFDADFKKAFDSFYGLDINWDDANPPEDDTDYTDYTMRQGEMGNPDRMSNEAFDEIFDENIDMQNGYDDIDNAEGDDFFPNGADSPVISVVGPSGARQGDNPEQKKMHVAEVHKELVYGYRKYLKETAPPPKKKITESAQISDLSIDDYYGDFDIGQDSIDYNGGINVLGKVMSNDGNVVDIGFDLDITASAIWEWENDESPTGWNHKTDQPTYTSSVYASVNVPEVTSVSFSTDQDLYIDNNQYSLRDAAQIIGPDVLRQLLNPDLYSKLMAPAFEKESDNIPDPEKDFDEPDPDYDSYDDRY